MLIIASVLKIILEYFYIFLVSPNYSYAGFIINFQVINYIFSWVLFLLLILYLMKVKDPFNAFILNLEFIVTILPLLVFYGLTSNQIAYIIFVFFSFFIQIYILKDSNTNFYKVGIYIVGIKKKVYYTLFFTLFIIVFLTAYYNGFHGLKAFDTVYLYDEIRKNTNYSKLFSYFVMWAKVLLPVFIIFSLYNKNKIRLIILFTLQLIFYMATGEKFIYLNLFVIFSVYIFSKYNFFIKYIYLGIIILLLVVIFSGNIYGVSFMGERFLFGPSLNKFLYFDFFSIYPKIYLSDGLIGKILGLTYPYTTTSGQLIFGYLFNDRLNESNSVTGMLGESFSQFGFLGMIFFSVIFAKLIKFIAETTNSIPNPVRCSVFSIFIVVLNDASFFTVFFSGGLFWTILLFYVFIDKKFSRDKKIVIVKIKIRNLFAILIRENRVIWISVIFIVLFALIFSNVSYNSVLSYSYSKNIEFNRLIFKEVYEKPKIFKIILNSTILGIFLSSFLVVLKEINKIKNSLKNKIL